MANKVKRAVKAMCDALEVVEKWLIIFVVRAAKKVNSSGKENT